MAKATKTTTTKTIKAVRDDATAKAAMAVVGKDLKNVNKVIDEIAAMPTEGKAQRNMCAAMFAWGLGLKATGKAAFNEKLYNERFDDYVEKHWKGDRPSDGAIKNYRSYYRAFCEMAWAKYDAEEVVGECLSIANVLLSWRAARMRAAIKLSDAPSKKGIAEMLTITATATGASDASKRAGDSVFKSLVNVLVDAAKLTKLHEYLDANPQHRKWLRPALEGAVNARNAEFSGKPASDNRTKMMDSVIAARAVLDGKRANVAATGRA